MSALHKFLVISSLFLVFLSLPTTNSKLQTVFANHCDDLDVTTVEGRTACRSRAGAEYCDGDQRFLDKSDGTHQFLANCAEQNQTCAQTEKPGSAGNSPLDIITYCKDKTAEGSTTSAPEADSTGSTSTGNVDSSLVTGSEGEKVSSSNYKAPQHANYTIENLEHSILCELAGMSPIGQCIGHKINQKGETSLFLYNQVPGGGAIGGLTNVMTALYQPPTSTANYLADLGQNLGLAKPAYAQSVGGSGEGIIRPVYTLWQVTRNLAYLAFTIVFVVVGFMIMFRQKISQQAVVSVQTALPGLVVGLILVTFSYFISALIIDLSFIGIRLVAELFIQAGPSAFGSPLDVRNLSENSSVFHLFGASATHVNFGDFVHGAYGTLLGSNETILLTGLVTTIVGAILGAILGFGLPGALIGGAIGGSAGTAAVPGIIGLIVPLILIIALFVQFFRLLFQLIQAYIALLVSTVTGPFLILASSLPGRSGALSQWWKTILANSLIFPAVFAGFLFVGLILMTDINEWNTTPPLFGGLPTLTVKLIIAYGLLMGLPGIPSLVKGALGVKDIGGIPQEATSGFLAGFGAAQTFAPQALRAGVAGGLTRLAPGAAGGGWQRRASDALRRLQIRLGP